MLSECLGRSAKQFRMLTLSVLNETAQAVPCVWVKLDEPHGESNALVASITVP
jgi:hypothetical protein